MTGNVEKPNGKAWVRLKLTYTDRVMDDRGVPAVPFKLASALARYADAETGIVDRSQAFLAEVVGVKLRALQLAIDLLVKRGHVVVLKPKGRKLGNRYRPVLRPKDDPDLVNMHEDAHETGSVDAHDGAHETGFHAHLNARSYAPPCAPSPVRSPVIDHPVSEATADRPPEARTTTTIGVADDGLLDQVRTAIETAGGGLVKRHHNLQPVRDLIAGGVPRNLAVAVIADRAAACARKSGPLGNLDATWLLDCIRDHAAAESYRAGQPAAPSITEAPQPAAETWDLGGGFRRTVAFLERAVAEWDQGFAWNDHLGFPPDSDLTTLPRHLWRSAPGKPRPNTS